MYLRPNLNGRFIPYNDTYCETLDMAKKRLYKMINNTKRNNELNQSIDETVFSLTLKK